MKNSPWSQNTPAYSTPIPQMAKYTPVGTSESLQSLSANGTANCVTGAGGHVCAAEVLLSDSPKT